MRRFLIKAIIMCFLVIISIIGIFFSPVKNINNYYMASVDKHNFLRTAPEPRIIFIGGSNLAFSLDSEMIEHELKHSSVNMGLQILLGLQAMLNEVKPYIKENDVLVIVPEYELFLGSFVTGKEEILIEMLAVNPSFIKYLSSDEEKKIFKFSNIAIFLRKYKINSFNLMLRNKKSDNIYARKAFNKNGDNTGHINAKGVEFNKKYLLPEEEFNDKSILLLNDFNSYATSKGARVFFAFPPLPVTYYKENEKRIGEIYDELKKNLHIKIIDSPEDYVFPDDLFYDTIYHLSGEGRKTRTQKLIQDLKKVL